MINRKPQGNERRNIFVRFFHIVVMLHKIPYAYFTEWNNKRKRKALSQGIYALSIMPEMFLLYGTLFAARGEDGYIRSDMNTSQHVLLMSMVVLAFALMAIPLGFSDDKKVCQEVRREMRGHARYRKAALATYWAVIVGIVIVVNVVFPMLAI